MSRLAWRAASAIAGAAALSAAGILLTLPAPVAAATHEVRISDSTFEKPVLTVQVGDSVTWINVDDRPHTVTGDGAFDSGNIDEGGSFSFTFTEPGTYAYICEYHPEMRATVVVQAASPETANPAPAAQAPASSSSAAGGSAAGADDGHEVAHADQPDTAMSSERSLPALSVLLWGVSLLCLAVVVVPSRRLSRAVVRRPPGGWRR